MKVFERFDEEARKVHSGSETPEVSFGVASSAIATALREFADSIEKGDALVQSVRELSIARVDDFPLTMVRITFVDTNLGTLRAAKS